MEAIVGLTTLVATGVSFLAYRHPGVYAVLFPTAVGLFILIGWAFLDWNIAIDNAASAAFSSALKGAAPLEINSSVEALKINPAYIFYIAAVAVFLILMRALPILILKLEGNQKRQDSE